MLVIEGPDLAGKSTLAKHICGGANVLYAHMGPPGKGERDIVECWAAMLDSRCMPSIVFDRQAIGDLAYRSVWPRENPTTASEFYAWCLFMQHTKSHVVWLDPTTEALRQRYATRGDADVSLDKIEAVRDMYRCIFNTVGDFIPHTRVSIDVDAPAAETIAAELLKDTKIHAAVYTGDYETFRTDSMIRDFKRQVQWYGRYYPIAPKEFKDIIETCDVRYEVAAATE